MALIRHERFDIQCDNCRKLAFGDLASMLDSSQGAFAAAKSAGWVAKDGKVHCPTCDAAITRKRQSAKPTPAQLAILRAMGRGGRLYKSRSVSSYGWRYYLAKAGSRSETVKEPTVLAMMGNAWITEEGRKFAPPSEAEEEPCG